MNIKSKTGTTLIEILFATLVFTIALSGLMSSVLAIVSLIDTAQETTIATSNLKNMMEKIRVTPFANIASNFPNALIDGPVGNPYSAIVGGYTLINEHIVANYANPIVNPLEINIRVNWQDKQGHLRNISLSTFKAR